MVYFFKKKHNFYDVIKPFFCLLKFFGFFQISEYESSKDVKSTFVDIILLLFWTLFFASSVIIDFSSPLDDEKFSSMIYSAGVFLDSLISSISQTVIPILNFYHRKKLLKIVRNIHLVDQKVCYNKV